MKKLILASQSPARRKLLQRLGIAFDVHPPPIDEDPYKQSIHDPIKLAQTLARVKAQSVFQHHPHAIVIGSDQVAHLQGLILGKPLTKERAKKILLSLRGQTHELINGVCLCSQEGIREWTQVDRLTMKNLKDEEIERYIEKDHPLSCAASYQLESLGIALFDQISSQDHTSIIGLPLLTLCKELQTLGINPLSHP